MDSLRLRLENLFKNPSFCDCDWRIFTNPSRCPWSCAPVLWWTCLPYISGSIRTRAHISSREWFCNSRSKCRPRRGDQSAARALPQDRSQRSPPSWRGMHDLDFPGKTLKWAHRDWPNERDSGRKNTSGGSRTDKPGTFSPCDWNRCCPSWCRASKSYPSNGYLGARWCADRWSWVFADWPARCEHLDSLSKHFESSRVADVALPLSGYLGIISTPNGPPAGASKTSCSDWPEWGHVIEKTSIFAIEFSSVQFSSHSVFYN